MYRDAVVLKADRAWFLCFGFGQLALTRKASVAAYPTKEALVTAYPAKEASVAVYSPRMASVATYGSESWIMNHPTSNLSEDSPNHPPTTSESCNSKYQYSHEPGTKIWLR